MSSHVNSALPFDGAGDEWAVEPMQPAEKSRLLRLLEAANPCGMEICQCEPSLDLPPELEAMLAEQRRTGIEPVFLEAMDEGDEIVPAKPSALRIAAAFATAAIFAATQIAVGNGIARAHADYTAAVAGNPAYGDFMGKVVEYRARKATQATWFASRDNDLALVYLESGIMMHAARPAAFNLASIGGISCLPGEGEIPMGTGEACHGVLPSRRKNDAGGALGLDKL